MSTREIAGRYRLESPIGQGAMGTVWRAHDSRLDRAVAVKIVEAPAAGAANPAGDTALERFRREAIATAALDHPNIVSVFDAGTDGASAYLVMELLHGTSVAELVREHGALPLPEALRIASELAAALASAHAAGIVHRDIKPANVMVSGDRVTVLDFGIAHLQGAEVTLTAPETAIGTAAYMAPEQAAGAKPGPAADTYALGCLIMTMVTGRPPFPGDNAIAIATQQISAPPPRLSSRVAVPVTLDALVVAMLSKKAFDRPDISGVQATLGTIIADTDPTPVGPNQPTAELTPTILTSAPVAPATALLPAPDAPASSAPTAGARTPATPLAPAPTAVLPALPSSIKAAARQTGYQTYERNPLPGENSGRWKLPVAIVIVLLLGGLAFAYAYESGRLLSAAPSVAASAPASARSAPPASSAVPSPTQAPSSVQPTSAPPSTSAPASSKATPAKPSSVSSLAVQAATKAVSTVLTNLPDSKAKTRLTQTWNTSAPQIVKGTQAAKRIQEFSDMVTGYQQTGDLSIAEAVALLAALETVKALI